MTSKIVLGTGVTCMPNHNPFVLAHRIAQLDHMARGRLHWGVGSGGFPGDFEVFGFDLVCWVLATYSIHNSNRFQEVLFVESRMCIGSCIKAFGFSLNL